MNKETYEALKTLMGTLPGFAKASLSYGKVEKWINEVSKEYKEKCIVCERDDVGLTERDSGDLMCDDCWV